MGRGVYDGSFNSRFHHAASGAAPRLGRGRSGGTVLPLSHFGIRVPRPLEVPTCVTKWKRSERQR